MVNRRPFFPLSFLQSLILRVASVKALHELALLHERGIEHVVFVDYEYSAELLAKVHTF
jgi:hypothetical protein